MKALHSALIVSLALMGLNGCTPTRVSDRVPLTIPERWHSGPAIQSVSAPKDLSEWWQGFGDPVLNDLIVRALAANQDLKIASSRVREAAALVTVAEAAFYPTLDFSVGGGREKRIDRVLPVPGNGGVTLTTPRADAFTAGLVARWELDVFGSRHLEAEAAAAKALGSEESRRAVQVGLLAQVATSYLELRGVQKQTAILRENISVQQKRLHVLQSFYRSGLANRLDVTRQEGLLRESEAMLPVLLQGAAALIHRLGVLLGEPPASLHTRLSESTPLPEGVPKIPELLPADLLLQRPDLRLAQTEVSAAAAHLGMAKAELLPKIILAGSGGFGALALGGFPTLTESVYTLGSGLTAPLFNAGRIRAQISAGDARLDQAAANYEKTFLIALEDVENAYVAHASALERRNQLIRAESAADRSHTYAEAFYQRGATDFLSVLDAQRTRLSTSDERTKAETAVRVSLVSIYRAFGGGWSGKSLVSQVDKATDGGDNFLLPVAADRDKATR